MTERQKSSAVKALEEGRYGRIPKRPTHLKYRKTVLRRDCFGIWSEKAQLELIIDIEGTTRNMNLFSYMPDIDSPVPAVIMLTGDEEEGIIEVAAEVFNRNGIAFFAVPAFELGGDDADFRSTKLATRLSPTRRTRSSAGKLSLWAWAALRATELAAFVNEVDEKRIALIGCHHLGEAAMLAAAYDERISKVVSHSAAATVTEYSSHLYCGRFTLTESAEKPSVKALYSLLGDRDVIISLTDGTPCYPEAEATAFLGAELCEKAVSEYVERGESIVRDGKKHLYIRSGTSLITRRDIETYVKLLKLDGEPKMQAPVYKTEDFIL